jgi:hypothetical protein
VNVRRLIAPLLLGALVLGGSTACGGERTFDADEFVETANREGAGLALGEPLQTDQADVDAVFALEFGHTGEVGREDEADDDHQHGGASLIVGTDEAAALVAYDNCEASVTLVCFRAANVAVVYSGDESGEEVQRLRAALVALSE